MLYDLLDRSYSFNKGKYEQEGMACVCKHGFPFHNHHHDHHHLRLMKRSKMSYERGPHHFQNQCHHHHFLPRCFSLRVALMEKSNNTFDV